MNEAKKEVIIEFERICIVNYSPLKNDAHFCSGCGTEVEFVSASEAAIIAETETSVIAELARNRVWHNKLNERGDLRICLNSLMKHGLC